jgi:hypothetical protein
MKKTYIIPTLEIVKIQSVRILAGSPNPLIYPTKETTGMETRRSRFSTWEEEDFDE